MRGRSRHKGKSKIPYRFTRKKSRPGKNERENKKAAPAAASSKALAIKGELHLHRDGYGFVVSGDPKQKDVFIPARYVGEAMHGDLVEAKIVGGGNRPDGRVTNILERKVKRLVGRLERQGSSFRVIADDRLVRHRIIIPNDKCQLAKHGDNVVVLITSYPSSDLPMQGEVQEVLGRRGDEETEKAAIMVRHQLTRSYPAAAEKEAANFEINLEREDIANRNDLTQMAFVTIDGETAKDFDDAVAITRLDHGIIRLWVSIADVSYVVRPLTALDLEAYARATSVYFPNDCIPMLPWKLSGDLCSLRPNEPRLTMTAQMDIDLSGQVIRKSFYRSVIKSKERMTYTSIKKLLVDHDPDVMLRYKDLIPTFELMRECFERLRDRRIKRGSIDFDLPESEIIIGMTGEVSEIVRAERHVGHMMIEDFMVAANEAVASFLEEKGFPCIYRIYYDRRLFSS